MASTASPDNPTPSPADAGATAEVVAAVRANRVSALSDADLARRDADLDAVLADAGMVPDEQ